jgi:hypothetical protein
MNNIVKFLLFSCILTGAFVSTSCTTLTSDITAEAHSDPDVDFNTYNSYAWLGSAQIVFDPIGQWEQPTLDTDEEVKFNINRKLRELGLYEAAENPELFVVFTAGIDMTVLELKEDPESKKEILRNVPKASLAIALIDAETGYIVWLGFAEGEVQEQQSIENIRKRIEYAVSEIFKSYNR